MDTKTGSCQVGIVETGVWLRLLSCTNIIMRHLRRNLKDGYGLTMPRFDLLAQVARPPIGPSLGELSRRLLVTKGNITDIVARLESVELIERRRDEADGRIQYVFLTKDGHDLYARILPEHSRWLADLMQEVSEDELKTLYEGLGVLKAALKRMDDRAAARGLADDADDEDDTPQPTPDV